MADLHRGLKVEVVDQQEAEGFSVALARTHNSKTDVGYGLHVAPSMFSTSGIQRNDLRAYRGRTSTPGARRGCQLPFRPDVLTVWPQPGLGHSLPTQARADFAGNALRVRIPRSQIIP